MCVCVGVCLVEVCLILCLVFVCVSVCVANKFVYKTLKAK